VKRTSGTVFVLAATNYPHLVDDAVLSRFEERLEIPNPGPDERKRMLRTFIGKRRVDFDVEALAEELGPKLDGLSGRALMALVRRASQQSAERAMDAGTPGQIVLSRQDVLGSLSLPSE
jgi:transitional endoplasmic reticulum ATPase